MEKNKIIVLALIVALAGAGWWFGYRYFFKKEETVITVQKRSIQPVVSNSCWVYHEFVYRVDFSDDSLESFLFVRNNDGTFSPSEASKPGNEIIANGFIIDSTGACVITERTATPWMLSDDEQITLRELVDAWLNLKPEVYNRDYAITGQTVALFVVLNDPKDFIEYNLSAPLPGQDGYSIIYPFQKTLLSGINTAVEFSAQAINFDTSTLQVLKTSFDENNKMPLAKTSIDSISATKNAEGFLENIKVFSGDEFFYEGATVFDEYGKLVGNLHYENNKWAITPILSFVQSPPTYTVNEVQEQWQFDTNIRGWKKTVGNTLTDKATGSEVIYKPGPLEPTIKVYPSPTPK